MSRALSSFLGGMAGGYITESNRQQDQGRLDIQEARQAKLDQQREREFALRERQLESQLKDQDEVRADKVALKAGQVDVAPADEWTQSVADKTPEEKQAIAERMSTGEDMGQEGVSVGVGAQQRSFLKDEAGLKGATAYKDSLNSQDAKAKRNANILRMQGKSTEAMEFEAKFESHKQELAKAQLAAVTNAGLGLIQQGDFAGLVKARNDHYKDGSTWVYNPGRAGGGSIASFRGDPADGDLVGTMNFKDQADAAKQFYATMNAAETIKSKIASEQKMSEERNKVQILANGAVAFSPAAGVIARNNELRPGEERVPDGSGGFRIQKAGDKPVHPVIKASFGESEGAMVAPATSLFETLMSQNKIPEAQAAKMAVQFTRGDFSNVVEEFDMDTGLNRRLYVDRDQKDAKGVVTSIGTGKKYLVAEDEYGKGERFTPAQAQAAVSQMQAKLPADKFAFYAATATPAGEKAFADRYKETVTALVTQAKKDLAAATTPEQQAAVKQAYAAQQEKMQAEARRADLVRQFYKPPAPKTAASVAKPAGPSFMDRASSLMESGSDRASRQALQEKVRMARVGGPPLTSQEAETAARYGLVN